MIGLLSTVLVTGFAALYAIRGQVTVGAVLAFAQLMGKLVGPISAFSGVHTQYKSTMRTEGNIADLRTQR